MTVSDDIKAKILRYFHVEKWRVGTISRQLKIHHSVVQRVLLQSGSAEAKLVMRPSRIDPFLPFILDTLTKYPKLTASRLYQMVVERGYVGNSDHFRHFVALHRPRPAAEAYFRLRTLPGEESQADWGHFGYINIGKAKRSLMAFVMVLSYSRKIFLRFYLNQRTTNFLMPISKAPVVLSLRYFPLLLLTSSNAGLRIPCIPKFLMPTLMRNQKHHRCF